MLVNRLMPLLFSKSSIKQTKDGEIEPMARKFPYICTGLEIMSVFHSELRGVCSYYALASNFTRLDYFAYLVEYSRLKTLAGKHTYDKEKRGFKNYRDQPFHTTKPDEVWVSDVTYFHLNGKKFYTCAALDRFARKIIGYRIRKPNSARLVKGAFRPAYESRQPTQLLTFHTNRGRSYKSKSFFGYLKSLSMTQSFSRAHVPYDNSVMESFFSKPETKGTLPNKIPL